MRLPFLLWNTWRSGRSKPAALAGIRQRRLGELVMWARTHSLFYAQRYRQVSDACSDLQALPVVTKPELMACFDDLVTDTAVTKAGVAQFVSDPALVGRLYLDRYAVHTTSGTTGIPGLFLHDRDALAVYDMLWLLRGWLPWLGPWRLLDALRPDFREVLVVATGAHFGGAATAERLRWRYPRMAGRLHNLSVLLPYQELVQRLNDLQPSVLAIYPTALSFLAGEQSAGRLPALRLEGRRDEILTFPIAGGATVRVLPMVLATVVETTPGVRRYQMIQTEPCVLSIRLEVVPGAERAQVWRTVAARLREFLTAQGLSEIVIAEAVEAPRRDSHSGKYRQVWSDIRVQPWNSA